MEVRRTVPVKLNVTEQAAESLHATITQFRWAANYVVANSRKENGYIETTKQRLHERTYQQVRAETDLQANLVQSARSRAADALKGVVARWKNGDTASLPEFTADFLDYDTRSATFHDDCVSLSTVDGRIEAEYVLPDEGDMDGTPHGEYLFSDEFSIGGATLHYHDGSFYLHVRTKADVNDADPSEHHPTVLGVENIAVTSTGMFWSGGYLNHRRNEYERVRGGLQRTGTESAHHTIGQIGDHESRWAADYLHRISKAIVHEAITHDCSSIAFEDLTGIRKRMPRAKKFHTWAFNRLYEYVEYKADAEGIDVVQVNPAYTSQRCSKCGHTADGNRPQQDRFACGKCGYEVHADYNGAKNIGFRHVQACQKRPSGRANRHLALKAGTLNGTGRFTPTDA